MAYCRWGRTCDVFMYKTTNNEYQFHLAKQNWKSDFCINDPEEALKILKKLQKKGLGVPNQAIDRLHNEIKEMK
jgi:hypothetical protein